MMCRSRARSSDAPSTFDAVFQLAVPRPITMSPSATATGLASTDVPKPATARPRPTMAPPIRVVNRDPSRITITPDADTERNDATVMHISRRPTVPGVRFRPSRIAGKRDTHDEKARPLAPYAVTTAVRHRDNSAAVARGADCCSRLKRASQRPGTS
ncbi:hypothetical protein AHiyo1_02300 [Arthrobacter sp. Hiyo1]|nr:hypothetical protein AHiyo1_02300 [Arthrobacter sp. Hiyo1]